MEEEARRHFRFWIERLGLPRVNELLDEIGARQEERALRISGKAALVVERLAATPARLWELVAEGFQGAYHQTIWIRERERGDARNLLATVPDFSAEGVTFFERATDAAPSSMAIGYGGGLHGHLVRVVLAAAAVALAEPATFPHGYAARISRISTTTLAPTNLSAAHGHCQLVDHCTCLHPPDHTSACPPGDGL